MQKSNKAARKKKKENASIKAKHHTSKCKAIIFDLDNTLVDFMRIKHRSCEEAMVAMIDAGLPIKKENGLKILYELYDKHGIEYKKIFQEFLKTTLGKIDYKILSNGVIAYRKMKEGYLTPYPHVQSTLLKLKLKGIKLAIVSDAPRMRAWLRLASLKLTDFFDCVITHEDTGKYKPNPKPFTVAMKKLGVKPTETIMVGDWPERDLKGAKALGITTCFAKYGYCFSKKVDSKLVDHTLDDVSKILKIV